MSEVTPTTFKDRRPCVAILVLDIHVGADSLRTFDKAAAKDRMRTMHELSAEIGMLQNTLQRFMWEEGMTAEIGLAASLAFTGITALGTQAQITLHSDMTDIGGFYEDFSHMMNGLRCRCWDHNFDMSWKSAWAANEHKEHIAHFVGAAHV